jgi:hypothetical protein
MRLLLAIFVTSIVHLLIGCGSSRQPQLYLSYFDMKQPQVGDFEVCASSGCRTLSQLAYTAYQWGEISAIFEPAPTSPADERERIKIAVAKIEQIVGSKNGTSGDAARNQRPKGVGKQLDCIAEAANTTVALLLFEKENLLRYHTVGHPQHRGLLHGRLPHNTASIYENATLDHYAVDSWFFKNGEPPICVPVNKWKAGYDPED